MLTAGKAFSEAISYKNQGCFHTSLTQHKHPSFAWLSKFSFFPSYGKTVRKQVSEQGTISLICVGILWFPWRRWEL